MPPNVDTEAIADDEAIATIINKFQVYCFPRRLRVKEYFVNYDHLRSGRVTATNFSRVLDTIGVRLTEKECIDLAEHFTQEGPNVVPPQVVNYAKFCQAIDEVYEEGPATADMTSSPSGTVLKTFQPNTVEDEQALMNCLHKLAALCKTRGIVLKECFVDLERAANNPSPSRQAARRAGKVTRSQFLRSFPFVKEFTKPEMEMLADRYKTDCGNVHFMALHNDVTEYLHTAEQPFARSELVLRPDQAEWAHNSLDPVAKLRSKVVERRIRIDEHFLDFDPLRKGVCTVRQVKTVFTILNIEKDLAPKEYDAILEMYTREDGLWCYREFCTEIDKDFTTQGLEKAPLAVVRYPDAETTSPARRNKRILSLEQETMLAEKIYPRLRYIVKTRGIHLNPTFTDMDRMNKGVITKGQFVRCLDMLNFGLDQESVAVLCAQYCDRGNHIDVNYRDFIRDVDKADEDQQLALEQHQNPHQGWSPPKYFDHRGRIGKEGVAVDI
jgi:Ca2+-binding EF-hand superfamily protein